MAAPLPIADGEAGSSCRTKINASFTEIDTKQATSEKGNANGYASLDASGKVPVAQIPASVGTGDVTGPASSTDGNLALFDGATGKLLKEGVSAPTTDAVGVDDTQTLTNKTIDADNNTISNLEVDNLKAGVLDTDLTTVSASDDTLASAKAVKTYVDNLLGANDAMIFKGVIDCSANPNYPSADAGHTYKISVAGKIGGASGETVAVGDMVICIVDGSGAGDQSAVGANWNILQYNLSQATESTVGFAPLATSGEAINGTNDTKIVTPLKLKLVGDTLPNIGAKTEKTSIADNDTFIIEDSADSNAKKKVLGSTIKALASGGGLTATVASSGGDYTTVDGALNAGKKFLLVKISDTVTKYLDGVIITCLNSGIDLTFSSAVTGSEILGGGDHVFNGGFNYSVLSGARSATMDSSPYYSEIHVSGDVNITQGGASSIALYSNITCGTLDITHSDNNSIQLNRGWANLNCNLIKVHTTGNVYFREYSNQLLYIYGGNYLAAGPLSGCTIEFQDVSSYTIFVDLNSNIVGNFIKGDGSYSSQTCVVEGSASSTRLQFCNNSIGGSLQFKNIDRGMMCNNMAVSIVASTGCTNVTENNNTGDFY